MKAITIFSDMIDQKILDIHTAFLGQVVSVSGNTARIQPLNMALPVGGSAQKASVVTAVVPTNIKCKQEDITYLTPENGVETTTVLVPDQLKGGDIVFVGVCERDITNAKKGIIAEPTRGRHHNENDGVILRVL